MSPFIPVWIFIGLIGTNNGHTSITIEDLNEYQCLMMLDRVTDVYTDMKWTRTSFCVNKRNGEKLIYQINEATNKWVITREPYNGKMK